MKKLSLIFLIICFSTVLTAQNWVNTVFSKSSEYVNTNNKREWYKGQISNKAYHGMGIGKWKDETLYVDDFTKGNINGYGIQIVPEDYKMPNCNDCVIYVGYWKNGVKSGKGKCYNKNGDVIYSGNFENNIPTETYPTKEDFPTYKFSLVEYNGGDKYLGEINDGLLNGYGIYVWNNGDLWFGNFKNGQRNGVGIYLFYNAEWITLDCKGDNCTQLSSSEEKRDRDAYHKAARAQVRQQNLGLLAEGLNTVATGISQVQELKNSSSDSGGNVSGSSNSGGATSSSGGKSNSANNKSSGSTKLQHSDISARTRVYSDYESQLIKMNTYHEKQYNDSDRRHIQGKMREVRDGLAKGGYTQRQSDWETWDGKKR